MQIISILILQQKRRQEMGGGSGYTGLRRGRDLAQTLERFSRGP